jgi:hypothetical protein
LSAWLYYVNRDGNDRIDRISIDEF